MTLRKIFIAIPCLIFFSTYGYAAKELNKSADHGEKVASISLSQNVVSPDDAKSQIHAIAKKYGANHYIINSLVSAGTNSSGLRVSAELYNC